SLCSAVEACVTDSTVPPCVGSRLSIHCKIFMFRRQQRPNLRCRATLVCSDSNARPRPSRHQEKDPHQDSSGTSEINEVSLKNGDEQKPGGKRKANNRGAVPRLTHGQ